MTGETGRRDRWVKVARLVHRVIADRRPERCGRCERRSFMWAAPSPLWNYVMRGNDINGDPLYGDLVCMSCFADLADLVLPDLTWRLVATNVPVDLTTITPSGRVWDDEAWLWRDPAPSGGSAH